MHALSLFMHTHRYELSVEVVVFVHLRWVKGG
jgi:hypothetical protein